MKPFPVRWFSLVDAPDRGRAVGVAVVVLAFGLFLFGSAVAPWVVKTSGLPEQGGPASLLGYAVMFGGPLVLWLGLGFQVGDACAALGLHGRLNALSARVALWGIPAGLILVQLVGMVGLQMWEWLGNEQPKAGHQVLEHLGKASPWDVIFQALVAVVLAPACEEALFRGILQTGAQALLAAGRSVSARLRWGVVVGVGVAFGLVHWGAVPPPMLPSLMFFGLFLGWSYEKTGCFWVPVVIHAGFNAVSFAIGLWQARQ